MGETEQEFHPSEEEQSQAQAPCADHPSAHQSEPEAFPGGVDSAGWLLRSAVDSVVLYVRPVQPPVVHEKRQRRL